MAKVQVTMLQTVYNSSGGQLTSGQTYMLDENLAGDLVGRRLATDVAGYFTPANSSANFRPSDAMASLSVSSSSVFYQMGSATRVQFVTSGQVRVRFGAYDQTASRTGDMLIVTGRVYDKPQGANGFCLVTDSSEGGSVTVNVALGS